MKQLAFCIISVFFLAGSSCLAADEMAPFVIPVDISPDSEIALDYEPLCEEGRLVAREHFYNQAGKRVRLWGVNLSFGANFPTHADAERVAKRMAAFGVNSVRFHHMDSGSWPRGIWDINGKTFHPEAVDRLDYFIDQLAKHGIYANINLHVGNKFSAILDIPESNINYDKMVEIFTPELIEAQKKYARQLLTRKNKYRNNMTYAEDYAVAIVEITNEDSLFMWSAEKNLRNLPEFYAQILKKQYNQWLVKKYGTQESLARAWTVGSEPLGENMLANADFSAFENSSAPGGWNLEQHDGCRAKVNALMYEDMAGILIEPEKIDNTGFHLQLNQGKLTLDEGKTYTVAFHAAAPSGRKLRVGVLQAHDPWENLGLSQTVTLGKKWKQYRMNFTTRQGDNNARLSFYFGDNQTSFYLANVSFQPGVEYAVGKEESLKAGTINVFGETESKQRQIDRMVFLAETEKAYFDEMKRFIKEYLDCKSMVTGTIVFGPLGLYGQSDMDFIDGHAYWQHPRFPGRPWDQGNWTIDQKAMSDHPERSTLYKLAAERLAGKPFTVTEYNHPAPLDSQAECVPMIASFAAAQDWDGVWLYTYSHSSDNWDREHMNSYFDIDTNPAKWGFMPVGAKMFRDYGLDPLRSIYTGFKSLPDRDQTTLEDLAGLHLKVDRNMLEAIGPRKYDLTQLSGRVSVKSRMEWDVINNQGFYLMRNDSCCCLAGHSSRFSKIQNPISVQIKSPDLSTIIIIALDGKPLTTVSEKILITACGRCENTGMPFSKDRRTVGKNWGTEPVQIESVEGVIFLPSLMSDITMTCKILSADGTVKKKFGIKNGMIPLKAEYGTMWYLIERTNP